MRSITRSRRRWTAGGAALAVLASGLFTAVQPTSATPDQSPSETTVPEGAAADKIAPEVQAQLEEQGRVAVWIDFSARADLGAYAGIADWEDRGQAVYDALTAEADASQARVRAELDAAGVQYQAFWGANVIKVYGATPDLLSSVASGADVAAVLPEVELVPPDPREGEPQFGPLAVEWGISDVNADDVWAEFGTRGEGVTVASLDTGAQYDHPALVEQYRGNNGDGSFTHDYNWLDVSGTSDEPVDLEGHGTHVTGTMVGDDGGENQIGVAPGAEWIAANGCCPSDEALLDSMQWMLAPTRVDGSDPDPAQRPHIVNNSWGTTAPSNDPFGEDIQLAWEAAGIFGMWANGNNAPGCETSGSPGSRIINYSAGNYDIEHVPAFDSSRGAGQDGEIKPNIAAPGTDVRSAVPGSGYDSYTGTSMASPHVAGAVALAWSAAPALLGDIPATKALLDGSAIDNPDDECGGTDADNNVFGEGRLDALALVQASPTEGAATLSGTVTDAESGDPLAGAQVLLTGPSNRTLTTGEDGAYSAILPAGDYTVLASAYGYLDATEEISLAEEEELVLDLALEPAQTYTLSGTVTDGSGHDWPLYALVSVDGSPATAFTDPVTGEYGLELPEGTWEITVDSQVPGYSAGVATVELSGDTVQDFALTVAPGCTAPGYQYTVDGVMEDFEEGIPEDWTVEDLSGSGGVWTLGSEAGRENETGGEGDFVIADSDAAGPGVVFDTTLVSPPLDLTDVAEPAMIFNQSYINFGDTADVDLSLDGGETWENVLRQTASAVGPDEVELALPQAAGQDGVHVRFRYYDADWAFYWQVDDVFVGSRTCDPSIAGGLVVGNVYDNDGEGINGATVTHDVEPTVTATTAPTPADENLDDGFYWLFAPGGDQPFTASATNYGTDSQTVPVAEDDAVRADFTLGSGELSLTPDSFEFSLPEGETDSGTLTITNDGDVDAEIAIRELPETYRTSTQAVIAADPGAPLQRVEGDAWIGSSVAAPEGGSPLQPAAPAPGPNEPPWTDMSPFPVPIQDQAMVNLDGIVYVVSGISGSTFYDTVWAQEVGGEDTWTEVAPIPVASENLAASGADGLLYAGTGWDEGGEVSDGWFGYDPGADTWTELAPNPVARSAAAAATVDGIVYLVGGCTTGNCAPMLDSVTAYDPAADTWTEVAPYPGGERAFLQCGGVTGALVCTGGTDANENESAESWSYDPAADEWTALPDAPNARWGGAYTEANDHLIVTAGLEGGAATNDSFAWDGAAQEWIDLPNSNNAVFRGAMTCGITKVGGGAPGDFTGSDLVETLPGFDVCTSLGSDVLWLDQDPVELTVPAGGSAEVEVMVDSTDLVPGIYESGLRFQTNTPDGLPEVPVTLTVERVYERWGGDNRYETAALISERFEPGVENVIVATGQDYPDALAGSAHAGSFEAPVLLVQGGFVPSATAAELERLQPGAITVLGGDSVVSDTVLADLEAYTDGDVARLEGRDRYATAAAVAGLQPDAERVYVATGVDYPDALAAAARAGAVDGPVLLTKVDALPSATIGALEAIGPEEIVVVGGDEVISDAVTVELRELGDVVVRVDGDDRYHTAMLLADELETSRSVFVATGQTYPDALTSSAWAGEVESPLVLVQSDNATSPSRYAVARLNPNTLYVFGGETAIEESVAEELRDIAEAPRPPDPAADER